MSETINTLRARVAELEANRDRWHRIADERSAEITRLDGRVAELEAEKDGLKCCGNCAEISQSYHSCNTERVKVLETALRNVCLRTFKPCPALPCSDCSGFNERGVETPEEACVRGKMDYFITHARKEIDPSLMPQQVCQDDS